MTRKGQVLMTLLLRGILTEFKGKTQGNYTKI